ncbi:MAG: ABC transporter ATP-binding protein, partial [Reyranella sp.]|nr:ABC transporter ATP-binding protein [Reyranella sp.]
NRWRVGGGGGGVVDGGGNVGRGGGGQVRGMGSQGERLVQARYGRVSPRSTVGGSIAQRMVLAGWTQDAIDERLETLLGWVGLPGDARQRFPHEFSGGQRQRIGIARALALSPKLIICDEPVSALDVSVRAQVINLLEDLKSRFGVSYLFISHDLSVVEHIADRVAVMYLGTLVEIGGRDQIWRNPQHPYTKALLAAAPVANPKLARARQRTVLQGELPSPLDPPAGCPFHSRCPIAQERCKAERPVLRPVASGAEAACHFI